MPFRLYGNTPPAREKKSRRPTRWGISPHSAILLLRDSAAQVFHSLALSVPPPQVFLARAANGPVTLLVSMSICECHSRKRRKTNGHVAGYDRDQMSAGRDKRWRQAMEELVTLIDSGATSYGETCHADFADCREAIRAKNFAMREGIGIDKAFRARLPEMVYPHRGFQPSEQISGTFPPTNWHFS